MMEKKSLRAVETEQAPAAIGPYSQAIAADSPSGAVYVSGQLPINPADGKMPDGIAAQTRQSLENIRNILEKEELSMANVVKTVVLLSDIQNFSAMNEVYSSYFKSPYPARAAFQVAALPKAALVEIEAEAVKGI